MQCNYCGAENPENAVFCKKCGRRLDGMSLCNACGKLTPSDGEFCIHCGSNRNAPAYKMPLRFPEAKNLRLNAKTETAYGNAAYKGEAKNKTYAQKCDETESYDYEKSKLPSKRIVNEKSSLICGKISLFCALAAALIGMIFVFLIGAMQRVGTGGGSGGVGPVQSIFYYFGEAYKTAVDESGAVSTSKMLGTVIGTVCGTVALASTAVCFILTVLRLVKILRKQTEKSIFVPAVSTYIAYICGIAMFLFCLSNKTETAGVTIGLGASRITIVGIILGAVFMVTSVILGVVSRGILTTVGEFVLHCTAKTVYAFFVFVVLRMIGGGAIFFGLDSISSAYGITPWFGLLAQLSAAGKSGGYGASLAVGILSFVFVLAFCVFLTFALSNLFKSVGDRADKRSNRNMLLSGVCAVMVGIFMLVGSSVYTSNTGGIYSVNAGTPVCVIIFGALIVAGVIVYNFLVKKFRAPGMVERNVSAEELTDETEKEINT